MKVFYQTFSFILCCTFSFSIYATLQPEDHSIREMTLDEVLISSHSKTSPDVIGGDVILPKNTPPKPSSYNSNANNSSKSHKPRSHL